MVKMFKQKDFKVFQVVGLEQRMAAIRAEIQPKFQAIAEAVVAELAPSLGKELEIHIAQHRRRTTNAPDFTWCGIGGDKRGYKKYPHFTIGITADYIVMWLSFIDNPQNEQLMAQAFLAQQELFAQLGKDFAINTDHTKNNFTALAEADVEQALTRWRDVKKGEFQVGRVILKEDPLLQTPTVALNYMLETYTALLPLYQLASSLS